MVETLEAVININEDIQKHADAGIQFCYTGAYAVKWPGKEDYIWHSTRDKGEDIETHLRTLLNNEPDNILKRIPLIL